MKPHVREYLERQKEKQKHLDDDSYVSPGVTMSNVDRLRGLAFGRCSVEYTPPPTSPPPSPFSFEARDFIRLRGRLDDERARGAQLARLNDTVIEEFSSFVRQTHVDNVVMSEGLARKCLELEEAESRRGALTRYYREAPSRHATWPSFTRSAARQFYE